MFRSRSVLMAVGLTLLLGATASGQTLKATAPVLTSPAASALLDTRQTHIGDSQRSGHLGASGVPLPVRGRCGG